MSGNLQPSIDAAEHIGFPDDGENIKAKRAASYGWGGVSDGWKRQPLPLIDAPYDYVGFGDADGNGNYQTLAFKIGGSGGTTVRTLALTYDGNGNVVSITRT